jgi:cell wall-associated NlpC family hydrolase
VTTGELVAARALALVGARFRLQGRTARGGFDCVGLVAAALGQADVRSDYALRGGSLEQLVLELERAGLVPVATPATGDVAVMRTGPAQLHLGVLTARGLVHADAGLRRVVMRPGPAPWPILQLWRVSEENCGWPPLS